jgi:CRISPR-associated exonuclease Cas4
MIWIALTALAIGLLLILAGKAGRRSRGLTDARTLDLDGRTLYSTRYRLSGRPDRIVEGNIPEEWKSGNRVYDSHRAQVGLYLILIEEETGVRPPHGFIVLGDGRREMVENTPELRAWVLEVAEKIRAARRELGREIEVRQPAAKCRACGMRDVCVQRGDDPVAGSKG